jgi:release factor glutamine methyltransferase
MTALRRAEASDDGMISMPEALRSVRELIQVTADFFAKRGIDSARLNAERLLGDVLGLSRLDLYLNHDRPLTPEEVVRYRALVRRRAEGEPLQHILGEVEFYGRSFKVEPGVFIPRPETERLVETAVGLLSLGDRSLVSPVALEIGAGTGVVGCSLAAELPRLRVIASDVNPRAVSLSRANARRLGVDARVDVREGALYDPFPASLRGHVNLIVSNPPYVRSAEIAGLSPEVARHDPREALDGGVDGLDVYHALARHAAGWLAPAGAVAVEIGYDQGEQVPRILAAAGCVDVTVVNDYNGLPRVVHGRLAAAGGEGA